MPDFALAMAAVTWLYCLFVFQGHHELFRDADSGWHIRTGERIAQTGELPTQDPYSFTVRGKPWFAWEWMADLAMGVTHATWGMRGVVALFTSVIAFSVWLWIRFTWSVNGDFLIAALLLPPFLSASSLHWLARPHVFSWPLILAAVWVAEHAPIRLRPQAGVALFLAGAVWANLHASFFVAPLIGLVCAAAHWLEPLLWPHRPEESHPRSRWLIVASVTFLAGTLVNPYGWHLHQHIYAYLTNAELLSRVAEFQSFNFHVTGAWQIVAVMTICFLGVGLALQGRFLGRALLILIFAVIALRSARGIPMAALVCLPLINGSLRSLWQRLRLQKLADGGSRTALPGG